VDRDREEDQAGDDIDTPVLPQVLTLSEKPAMMTTGIFSPAAATRMPTVAVRV